MRKRRRAFIVLMLCSITFSIPSVFAELREAESQKAETQKTEKKAKADDEKIMEKLKRTDAKKAELNGSEWKVQIKTSAEKSSLPATDSLIFQNGKFSSAAFSEIGFPPTNYTLTVPESEDAAIVWETMQSGPKGQLAFWRGEWTEKEMWGTIVKQLEKGNEEYTFASSGMKRIPPASPKKEDDFSAESEPLKVLSSEPTTSPLPSETQDQKTKKKGWFS